MKFFLDRAVKWQHVFCDTFDNGTADGIFKKSRMVTHNKKIFERCKLKTLPFKTIIRPSEIWLNQLKRICCCSRICTLAEMTRDGQERKIAFWRHPKMSKDARGMGSSLVEADEQLEWQKYVLNTTAHHLGRNCCSSTSTKDVPYIGMWPFNGLPRKLN